MTFTWQVALCPPEVTVTVFVPEVDQLVVKEAPLPVGGVPPPDQDQPVQEVPPEAVTVVFWPIVMVDGEAEQEGAGNWKEVVLEPIQPEFALWLSYTRMKAWYWFPWAMLQTGGVAAEGEVQLVVPMAFQIWAPMPTQPEPFQSWLVERFRTMSWTRFTALLSEALPEMMPLPAAWTDERSSSFAVGFTRELMLPVGGVLAHPAFATHWLCAAQPPGLQERVWYIWFVQPPRLHPWSVHPPQEQPHACPTDPQPSRSAPPPATSVQELLWHSRWSQSEFEEH
jgi:hypothetical protein